MFTDEELYKLVEATHILRKIIIDKDYSETERNISNALVYLDCARLNMDQEIRGDEPFYAISSVVVISHK